MAINASTQTQTRELIPSGNYIARCYSMIHVGTNIENIMGLDKILNKVRITWELPTELRVFNEEKGEQQMVISKEYTLSMHEKANLRKDLESWRGKGFTEKEAENFDITKLLGIPCMLSVIHKKAKNGNDYAIISGIATLPKGTECPEQINQNFEFNFEDKFNEDILNGFPEFIKDKIKSSNEYKRLINPEQNEISNLPESEDINEEIDLIKQQEKDLPF